MASDDEKMEVEHDNSLEGKLCIWFIDVGQGDGTFIKFPDETTMLVDLGSTKFGSKSRRPKEYGELRNGLKKFFMDAKGITQFFHSKSDYRKRIINYLILTHPDRDHYNLIHPIFLKDKTKKYTFSKIFLTGKQEKYGSLNPYWQTNKIKPQQLCRPSGEKEWLTFGDAKVHILSANYNGHGRNATLSNTGSIVLMIEYKETNVILAADATYLTEAQILNNVNSLNLHLTNSILKLGHHGSALTSTSKEWVEAVKPICLFISADRTGTHEGARGKKSGHAHPHQDAIDSILQYSKDEHGNDSLQCTDPHCYVAYYPKKDYSHFGQLRNKDKFNRNPKFSALGRLEDQTFKGIDDPLPYNSYYEIKTNKQIFTSLCKLDFALTDHGMADQGESYLLMIDDNGHKIFSSTSSPLDINREWKPTKGTEFYYIPEDQKNLAKNRRNKRKRDGRIEKARSAKKYKFGDPIAKIDDTAYKDMKCE
ncbi:MAG: hypothetical protein QNJ64_13295 [Crocosphaera sp.]|nr:hypothetical protein [Crocosphaera sp.]